MNTETDHSPPTEPAVADLDYWKRVLIRQAFQLSSANFWLQIARFVKNFLFARILGPNLFGLWNGLQLILVYGTNSHLGILHAIAREIPLSRGRGDLDLVPRLARVSMTFSLLASLVLAVIIFAIGAVLPSSQIESGALKLLAAVLVVQQLFMAFQFLFRAEDNFALLSKVLAAAATIELVSSVTFVYFYGLYGIFYGFLATGAAIIAMCLYAERRVLTRLELDLRLAIPLIRIGFPIMLTVLASSLLTTIDRLMIIKFLGNEALGYYAIGPLAIMAIRYVPATINQVMYPKFGERFGATGDPRSLSGFVRVPTLITAYVMAGVLGAAVLALPLVALLLPKYTPGLRAARILFAGFYFFSLTGSCTNLLLTINRQVQVLVALLLAVLVAVGLAGLALGFGLGIEGVALAMGVAYLLFAVGYMGFTVRRYLGYGAGTLISFLRRLLVPLFLGASLAMIAMQIQISEMFLRTAVQLALFAIVYAGLSFILLRRQVGV